MSLTLGREPEAGMIIVSHIFFPFLSGREKNPGSNAESEKLPKTSGGFGVISWPRNVFARGIQFPTHLGGGGLARAVHPLQTQRS